MSSEKRIVASAWHPQPMRELINLNHCDVRVLAGEAGYQLSTGEMVRVN